MNFKSLKICTVALSLIAVSIPVSLDAALLTVTSLADSGPGSLRDEVAASVAGDTIQFGVNGTIVLNGAIIINHSLNIYGPGPSALVIDANHVDRAFTLTGNNSTDYISGVTVTNGFVIGLPGTNGDQNFPTGNGTVGGDSSGGAILGQGNWLVLSNCWLVGNTVQGGQGGYGTACWDCAVYVPGHGGGGGLAAGGAVQASGVIFNCTFSDNQAIGGLGGDGGIGKSIVTAGFGGYGGGADGGAINGFWYVTNSTFSGNTAVGGDGGAGADNIAADGSGGNGGGGGSANGGAIYGSGSLALSSCTIVSNSAVGGMGGVGGNGTATGTNGVPGAPGLGTAGGVYIYTIGMACIIPIANTILADNYASTVQSNYLAGFEDQGYNFIGSDDVNPGCPWGPTTQVGTVASPISPGLGPLAQNGSGLPTHAPLLQTTASTPSPVIDAGYSFGLTTDERGAPRPYDFPSMANAAGGDGSDIGAFELGSPDLGLNVIGADAVVSWPGSYGDFILQSSTVLEGSNNWTAVPNAPVLMGSQLVVTNRLTNPEVFFRLRSQ
jgi:hypothetical protein